MPAQLEWSWAMRLFTEGFKVQDLWEQDSLQRNTTRQKVDFNHVLFCTM